MSDNDKPGILNSNPEPEFEPKVFHKTHVPGWAGFVNIDRIHGWAENKRIELFRLQCIDQFGRLPTDDEIDDFMMSDNDEFHIKDLAKSILYNGVRVPVILASDGTLLDGNRRYVATKWAMRHNPDDADRLRNMPAWVLSGVVVDETRQKILVECNFLRDWKVEWPNYIKALTVYEDHTDAHIPIEALSERYGLTRGEARKMVKVMELIQEFLSHNEHTDEAIRIAYARYPLFEEAHNKFRGRLDSDPDFKEQFFDWMKENKFKSYLEVRPLSEIRDNEEAWAMILSDDPSAVKAAIHIVQGEKLPSPTDGEKRVKKVAKMLRELKEHEIASISPETLIELQDTLGQVIRMAQAVLFPGKVHIKEAKDASEST